MAIESANPETLLKPHGYTHATIATGSRTIYLSGQVSVDVNGELVGPGDYAVQAERAMLNLVAALEGAGGSATDLAKLTIYVVDHGPSTEEAVMTGFARAARAAGTRPVATMLLGVQALGLPEALVEVDGVAVLD